MSASSGRVRIPLHGLSMTFPAGSLADERRFLADIERQYGTPIVRLPFSSLRLLNEAREVVSHLEAPRLVWGAQRDLLEHARRAGCRVVVDGFYGDQLLSGQAYLVDLARRGRWLTIKHDLAEFASWATDVPPGAFGRQFRVDLLRSIPPRWLRQALRERLAARTQRRMPQWYRPHLVERALARGLQRKAPRAQSGSEHPRQCYRNATSGHYLAQVDDKSAAGSMHGVDVVSPFRDRDLVAFVMATPGRIVNWQGVPKGLFRESIKGIVPHSIRLRRWKADFTALNNAAVLDEYADVVRLLGPDCYSARLGLVDFARLPSELARARGRLNDDQNAAAGWQIADLAALELWLRCFFVGVRAGSDPVADGI